MNNPQIIYENDKPIYAVITWQDWLNIQTKLNPSIITPEDIEDEQIGMALAQRPVDPVGLRPYAILHRIDCGENAVKVYREWRGLTQQELANATNTSLSLIGKVEAGIKPLSTKLKVKIIEALNLDPDDLDN